MCDCKVMISFGEKKSKKKSQEFDPNIKMAEEGGTKNRIIFGKKGTFSGMDLDKMSLKMKDFRHK